MSSNSGISDHHTLLITILNRMYDDNLRQITSLQESNLQIRTIIVDLLSNTQQQQQQQRQRQYVNIDNINRYNNDSIQQPNYPNQTLIGARLARENARRLRENARRVRETPNTPIIQDTPITQNTPTIRNALLSHYQYFPSLPSINANLTNYLQSFLEPIDVYPTQQQIENATRNVLYRNIVEPTNQSCPISLEPFQDDDIVSMIRYCGHIFHRSELIHWFETNCKCPVCRYDIRNYSANNQSPLTNNSNETSENDDDIPYLEPNTDEPETIIDDQGPNTEENESNIDISGNRINRLADIFINNFLNSYSGINGTYETLYLDIAFDSSNNYLSNINGQNTQVQSRNYIFPMTRRTQ